MIFNYLFMVPCCYKTPEEERSLLFTYGGDGDEKDGDGASDNDEEET